MADASERNETDGLRRENEALRLQLSEGREREASMKAELSLLRGALESIPEAITIVDARAQVLFENPISRAIITGGEETDARAAARGDWVFMHPDRRTPLELPEVPPHASLEGRILRGQEMCHIHRATGAEVWLRSSSSPIRDAEGRIIAAVACIRNVNLEKAAEEALAERTEDLRRADEEKAALIEQLEALVAELSTPLLEVWDGVVVVPVVGAVDEARSNELIERVLAEVAARSIRAVIVDLTAARLEGAASAAHLSRLATAIGLLGAACLVAGVSPEVARALVSLDAALPDVRMFRNLKHALRFWLARGA